MKREIIGYKESVRKTYDSWEIKHTNPSCIKSTLSSRCLVRPLKMI